MTDALTITHDAAAQAFEAVVDGRTCEAAYRLAQDGHGHTVMLMTHTGVPRPLEGRGIAAQLVAAAMAHARGQGWKVRPLCSYVRTWLRRHPEHHDLLEQR